VQTFHGADIFLGYLELFLAAPSLCMFVTKATIVAWKSVEFSWMNALVLGFFSFNGRYILSHLRFHIRFEGWVTYELQTESW